MNILSISAQKPDSTGSGTYLTELVRGWNAGGHNQAVIAGIYDTDSVDLPSEVKLYPVVFNSPDIPFPLLGMSDSMPYETLRYRDMSDEQLAIFKSAFERSVKQAVKQFKPDLIVCHHLYIVTSVVRNAVPDIPVVAICHGTCLRQFNQHNLEHDYIYDAVRNLDGIFALHNDQAWLIRQTFNLDSDAVHVIGCGYNPKIFNKSERSVSSVPPASHTLIYAGKVTFKKGIYSLLEATKLMNVNHVHLILAGGYNNQEEYDDIKRSAADCPVSVECTGPLSQQQLAQRFRQADLFVLPSFFEGLPLVLIEAMACGCRVVTTDLPGVREWITSNIANPPIDYVRLPQLYDVDTPETSDLPAFEQRLAHTINEALARPGLTAYPDTEGLSWSGVCKKILLDVAEF